MIDAIFSSTAYAQQAVGAAKSPSLMDAFMLPALFVVVMYFFFLRPQAKKAKEQQSLLKALKAGDEVVTSGGVIGKIKSISDAFVTLECSSGTFLKVVKGNILALAKDTLK